MSVKISELPILDSLADNDVIAGVDTSANVTSKIEMATLKNYIDTNTQYTAGTNINITNNVVSAPNVYNKTETDGLIDDLETNINEQLEEKDEQIEELQSEVDSLSTIYNAFPTESGEGESLTLDDTAEVKFKKFDLKGNTSQTQYTGTNILDVEHSTVESLSGITSVTKGNNFINGTTSAIEWAGLQLVTTLEAGTYYYKHYTECSDTANSNGLGTFRINKGSQSGTEIINQNVSINVLNQINSATFTITEAGTYVFVYRFGNATAKARNIIIKDIILSKTDVTYEPYVGATASPNPSYPQPVNVVSGDNKIDIVGKNLLNPNLLPITKNGITISKNSNGDIVVNGTITGIESGFVSFYIGDVFKVEPGTYSSSVENKRSGIGLNTAGFGGALNITMVDTVKTKTATATETQTINPQINIRYDAGTFTNFVINPMIEKNSSATSYEPYNGNNYNIDLPVENLLQLPNGSKTTNGITATITNGKLKIVGTTTTNWFSICALNIPLESGTYTFSYTNKKVNRYNLNIKYADNTTQVIYGNSYSNTPITLSQKATITGMFSDNNTTGATFDYEDYLMIEKGSKANTYTPYGTTPIELCKIGNYQDYFGKSDGRNLFDKDNLTIEIGTISATGTFDYSTERLRAYYIEVDENTTYTVSTSSSDLQIVPYFYNSSKTFLSFNSGWKDFPYTFTTPSNTKYIALLFKNSNNIPSVGMIGNLQLEKGSSVSDYQPYGVGKWYLHKEIKKKVLNGTETWTYTSVTQGSLFRTSNTVTDHLKNDTYSPYSDYYKGIPSGTVSQRQNNQFYIQTNFNYLDMIDNRYTNANDYKDWIINNNVSIYYILATPTGIEITYQPLIDQLNLLEKALSKQGQTNVSQVNNDKPFILDVTAIKSLQSVLDRIELLES